MCGCGGVAAGVGVDAGVWGVLVVVLVLCLLLVQDPSTFIRKEIYSGVG